MESVLSFESLLAPITADQPTGTDPRADRSPSSPYYLLKDLRSRASNAERQQRAGQGNGEKIDWESVAKAATSILATQAKDLEVTAWLIEALLRQHGFAGLRDGFRVARELVEKYWENLYPTPDEEDGVARRVAAFVGLNGEDRDGVLIFPINITPITGAGSVGPLGRSAFLQAAELEGIADPAVQATRVSRGATTMETMRRAIGETKDEKLREIYSDLKSALDEFERLTEALDSRAGSASPPTSTIRLALEGCIEAMEQLAKERLEPPPPPIETMEESQSSSQPDQGGLMMNGSIHNREAALQALSAVAKFFRQTEPHSPVSYAVEQAVRWARLPLPNLLAELIPEETSRRHLFTLAGIAPPKEGEAPQLLMNVPTPAALAVPSPAAPLPAAEPKPSQPADEETSLSRLFGGGNS